MLNFESIKPPIHTTINPNHLQHYYPSHTPVQQSIGPLRHSTILPNTCRYINQRFISMHLDIDEQQLYKQFLPMGQ